MKRPVSRWLALAALVSLCSCNDNSVEDPDFQPVARSDGWGVSTLEEQGIDILFADPNVLGTGPGRTILSQYIKPRATILMHIGPGDVQRLLKDLGPTTPNLHAFSEPMEKQFFAR